MTWLGHKGRVELSNERSNPIRQDRSNRDEVSEWRPATPRQPHTMSRDRQARWTEPTEPWIDRLDEQRLQNHIYSYTHYLS